MDGAKLGPEAVAEIGALMRRFDGVPLNPQMPPPSRQDNLAPHWHFFKVASGPTTIAGVANVYTGSVVTADSTGVEVTLVTTAYALKALSNFAVGSRYPARLIGELSAAPLYLAFGGVNTTGYTGTETIVTGVSCSGSSLTVTTKVFVWENGLLISVT